MNRLRRGIKSSHWSHVHYYTLKLEVLLETYQHRIQCQLQLEKLRKLRIRLHYSFIIIFILVTWSLSVYLIPISIPGLAFMIYLSIGVIGAVVLFSSVILHELAHSIMAVSIDTESK